VALAILMPLLCRQRKVSSVVVHLACGYSAQLCSVPHSFASLQNMEVMNCVVSTVAQLMLFDQSFAPWMCCARVYATSLLILAKA
jgi:hypothetical protein